MTQSSTPALPPLEIDAAEGPFPLGMPPERFLRDYWQYNPPTGWRKIIGRSGRC